MSARTGSRWTGVLRRMHSDEDGVALVVVVGSMLVLAMFMMVGLTYAISSTRFSRLDQDYTAAMTAAQSGIEDYISRLNRDDNYGRSPDCTATSAMINPTDCGGAPYSWGRSPRATRTPRPRSSTTTSTRPVGTRRAPSW